MEQCVREDLVEVDGAEPRLVRIRVRVKVRVRVGVGLGWG